MAWIGVNSDTGFAPDGVKRSVPVGEWFTATFIHNGTGLWLYLNNQLVGVRQDISSPIFSVQGSGVHIGAWPNQNEYMLDGALDELRIWKFDPQFRYKRFFCRPMEPEQEACWRSLLSRIAFFLTQEKTRAQMIALMTCIEQAEGELVRAVLSKGKEAVDRNRRFSQRYDELWCNGKIDGSEMQELMADWGAWIQETAGNAFCSYQQAIIGCSKELKGLDFGAEIKRLKQCDTAFEGFLGHVDGALLRGLGLVKPNDVYPYRTKKAYPSETD